MKTIINAIIVTIYAHLVRFNGGNIKLGNMLSFSKLYGDMEHFVKRLGFSVRGTCGGHCAACRKDCYVRLFPITLPFLFPFGMMSA